FFLGLLEKMLRQLRQRFGRKMRRDRVILQLRAELVPDLFIYCINDLLTRQHTRNLPRITRMQTNPFRKQFDPPESDDNIDAIPRTEDWSLTLCHPLVRSGKEQP